MAPKNTTSRDSHHDAPSLHGSCDQQPSIIRECAPLVGLRNVTLAKSIENHSENRSKIDPQRRLGAPKSESKSLPGRSRETPWRERASRRRLRSVSGACRSVPGALRECPESRQGRPRVPEGVPWSAWERAEATKFDAKSRTGAEKWRFLRAAHSWIIVDLRRFSL